MMVCLEIKQRQLGSLYALLLFSLFACIGMVSFLEMKYLTVNMFNLFSYSIFSGPHILLHA